MLVDLETAEKRGGRRWRPTALVPAGFFQIRGQFLVLEKNSSLFTSLFLLIGLSPLICACCLWFSVIVRACFFCCCSVNFWLMIKGWQPALFVDLCDARYCVLVFARTDILTGHHLAISLHLLWTEPCGSLWCFSFPFASDLCCECESWLVPVGTSLVLVYTFLRLFLTCWLLLFSWSVLLCYCADLKCAGTSGTIPVYHWYCVNFCVPVFELTGTNL
jgi:hypothetical protein